MEVVTREVAAALDRTNTSDRNAAHSSAYESAPSEYRDSSSALLPSAEQE